MEGHIQTMIESGQEDSDDLRTRVYVETMGPERHNRVRGYGHGVTPDMVSYASSSASSSNSSRRSSRNAVALLKTENNQLRRIGEVNAKKVAELQLIVEETRNQTQINNQLLAAFLQKFQPQPPHSPGTQHSAQSQPPPAAPVYPYTGYNQQPPSHPMYPTPPMAYMQQPPMPYMQQPHMPYMQQPPNQMPAYRPEMLSSGDVPIGVLSGMLAGAPLDIDMAGIFGSRRGSEEGSRQATGSHSGSASAE